MSKSRGNVINPDTIVKQFGADTLRLYEMFMGPFEQMIPWDTKGVVGCRRFIDKVYNLATKREKPAKTTEALEKLLHKTIKKVTEDIEHFKFNTAVSQMMILLNTIEKAGAVGKEQWKKFLQILAPFAPHITEEIWRENFEHRTSIHCEPWPAYDPKLLVEDTVTIVLQVNGKVRDTIKMVAAVTEGVMLRNSQKAKSCVSEPSSSRMLFDEWRAR